MGNIVEDIDRGLAEIWKAVEAAGEAGNTIFIFTSDNGPWLNAPQRMFDDGFTKPYHIGAAGVFSGLPSTLSSCERISFVKFNVPLLTVAGDTGSVSTFTQKACIGGIYPCAESGTEMFDLAL